MGGLRSASLWEAATGRLSPLALIAQRTAAATLSNAEAGLRGLFDKAVTWMTGSDHGATRWMPWRTKSLAGLAPRPMGDGLLVAFDCPLGSAVAGCTRSAAFVSNRGR
ncbi:hypothetical protein GCM10022251_82500 [Phytohabitans flavus]|uniref:Uncharacterized protein n=1 Tax=Phytohabitans flavus TaxID=1076124 RepID=A0A6F8Y936_9ACTN|nr:hypothetical protein Pflav_089430 [Phytohabitans flavus]